MHTPPARSVANLLNLTSVVGLVMARTGGAAVRRTPEGLWIAEGYRWPFPRAGAFTVGDVVLTRHQAEALLAELPDVLTHERAHARQYAVLGVWFWPLYLLGTGWSLARTGHPAWANPLERHAGLVSGGYADASGTPVGARWWRPVLRRASERSGAGPSGSPGGAGAAGADA